MKLNKNYYSYLSTISIVPVKLSLYNIVKKITCTILSATIVFLFLFTNIVDTDNKIINPIKPNNELIS